MISCFLSYKSIVEILIFLWIKTNNINPSRIIIIKLRDNATSLINHQLIFNGNIFDRIFRRIGFDTYSNRIDNFIKKKSINYYLYSSWVHPEFNTLLNKTNCLGHFYLRRTIIIQKKKIPTINEKFHINAIKNQKEICENLETYHKDAIYFIAIDPQAFPHVEDKEKDFINRFGFDKEEIYEPILLSKKFIGIGPAPRRLKKTKLKDSLSLLANRMPDNSIIKLHPGFKLSQRT